MTSGRRGPGLATVRGVPRVVLAAIAVVVLLAATVAWLLVGRAAGGAGTTAGVDPPTRLGGVAVGSLPPPVPLPSVDARGRVVVIDPGHDGGNGAAPAQINRKVDAGGFLKECDTVGAETDAGYPEHAFTFDVATRAAALLRARGVTVVLTRDDDTGVGPCVDARARAGAAAHADVSVSIHADGGPPGGSGFHVIAPNRAPDGVNEGILAASARLATGLRDAYEAATGERPANYLANQEGIVDRSDLGGLNLSTVPKVFIECANMRNAVDAARVSDPVWRQRAAEGIVAGILRYLAAPPG
ncbi:N-acetylmuramoyl-L-alanine amidase [Frankia sp. AgB1.9]|nr:N-acetylmuramoyl-L-alanine amidase [Frankia sp. AgW1.1]MBL7550367.1 N-acetylmuramoyl-L-alanine amidase [Frankia sp. AgB1.9]MBL7621041.1 N-acetylmuramoyl-L-alanine amidase [Frankia sp. AgB1.8]